jgi:hypothetical protein
MVIIRGPAALLATRRFGRVFALFYILYTFAKGQVQSRFFYTCYDSSRAGKQSRDSLEMRGYVWSKKEMFRRSKKPLSLSFACSPLPFVFYREVVAAFFTSG